MEGTFVWDETRRRGRPALKVCSAFQAPFPCVHARTAGGSRPAEGSDCAAAVGFKPIDYIRNQQLAVWHLACEPMGSLFPNFAGHATHRASF